MHTVTLQSTPLFLRGSARGSSVSSRASRRSSDRSQTRITCDRVLATDLERVHRGIDFLKVNFQVTWDDYTFLDTIDWIKRKIQETEDAEMEAFINKGLHWNVQRTGTSKFSYRLKAGDVTLMLSRREPKGQMPNVRLEVGSLSSQTCLLQIVTDVKHWLERQQANFVTEQVAEVHLAADFIGLATQSLDIENQGRWIQRSQSFTPNYMHRRLTGISMGKGDFMLRIYDKVTELKGSEHKQEVFRDLWQVDSFNQFPVTRVEFQLRRPVLKQFNHKEYCNGIDTVKQLLFGLAALWNYATEDWAKFMANVVDRDNNHQSRAVYSDFWLIVRSVVWTGIVDLNREAPIKHKNIEALRKQARGILMSIAAFFIESPEDIDAIVNQSQEFIEQDLRELFEDEANFIKRMMKKRNEVLLNTIPF
nr:hypothetical protein [uncultured Desulfobulbus sp.]